MIAAQPNLGHIGKGSILRNFLRIDVAMIIYNWELFDTAVIQLPGCCVVQKKILIKKSFHKKISPFPLLFVLIIRHSNAKGKMLTIIRKYLSEGHIPDELMMRKEVFHAILACKQIFIE